MYCIRCRIETGEDTFCENCGGATVANSEVAATVSVQSNIPEFIKENIKREQVKIQTPKLSLKKVIGLVATGIIIIGGLAGHKTLQAQYTPIRTVETFYNYIVKNDYDSAYKMLVDTDDRYMTKENFKAAMSQKNIKSFYIKNYSKNELTQDHNSNTFGTSIHEGGNMFTVQTSSKLYPVSVIENGSKLVFFKNYKINAVNFTIKWQMVAPQGAKISINGKEPEVSTEPNLSNELLFNDKYKPTTVLYQIDNIFQGTYDITAKMDGAEDVTLKAAQAGQKATITFNPNADTVKKLQDQAKAYLDLYYSKASQDKYASLLTTDSNALSKMSSFFGGFGYGSDSVSNKLKDLKVTKSQLDDADHAIISVKGSVDYEDSSMVQWGGQKQTGTKDMTTQFYFQRVNGNWLICDTDYIN